MTRIKIYDSSFQIMMNFVLVMYYQRNFLTPSTCQFKSSKSLQMASFQRSLILIQISSISLLGFLRIAAAKRGKNIRITSFIRIRCKNRLSNANSSNIKRLWRMHLLYNNNLPDKPFFKRATIQNNLLFLVVGYEKRCTIFLIWSHLGNQEAEITGLWL